MSWASKHIVSTDATPDDEGTFSIRRAVFERGSAVRRPCHLEDGIGALDALDPETRAKLTDGQIRIEALEGCAKSLPIVLGQRLPIALEPPGPFVRRHGRTSAERLDELVRASAPTHAPSRDVLACLPLPLLPILCPEPGLVGIDELLRAHHDGSLLDADLEV